MYVSEYVHNLDEIIKFKSSEKRYSMLECFYIGYFFLKTRHAISCSGKYLQRWRRNSMS
jgi:hypothetical protein